MKDHTSGCTFGGFYSTSAQSQGNWYGKPNSGVGIYVSNEWPQETYDSFDVGSMCVIIIGVLVRTVL